MARLIPDPDERGELFSAYLDDELTPDEVAMVGDALEGNPEAVAEFDALRDIRSRLRLLPEYEVPAALLPDGHLGDRLSAYLDGELASIEHQWVTKHLIDCPDCRSELQALDRARTAIRSLPGVDTGMTDEIPVTVAPKRHRAGMIAGTIGAVAAALVLFFSIATAGNDQPVVTLNDLATRHVARASAEPAFSIMPAMVEASSP